MPLLMANRRLAFPVRLALAVGLVLLAAGFHQLFEPRLGTHGLYLSLTVAMLFAVIWAGPRASATAAVVAVLLGIYLTGRRETSFTHTYLAGSFLIISIGMVVVAITIKRAQTQATESARLAEVQRQQASALAEELNLLIESAQGQAIYMLDPDGRVSLWNKGAERLTGWTEDEAVGQHVSIFYTPEAVRSGKPAADLNEVAGDGGLDEEAWQLRRDGTQFLARTMLCPLHDDDGRLRGFARLVTDITQQRAAADAIRASENYLRSILSTVPDAMIVIDEAGAIQSFSAAAETCFGYTESEVIGRNISILMPSPHRERHDSYLRHYLETGEQRVIGIGRVFFAQRKDGTQFPIELSVGEAGAGAERTFIGFIRDLTERRQAEERVETLQAELIHVSRASAMGAMASTLAHELNQPIAAVVNYVEGASNLLRQADQARMPMILEALGDAAREALRAGEIVRHLRNFVARGDVEKTIEALPNLINEAAALGLLGARENGLQTHFDFDREAAKVLVDKVQIQQVLVNLIRNAMEAMKDSPKRLLTILTAPDRAGFVRVSVSDTGRGIPPGIADKLFSAFVSSKTGGMGLGLSICRTIVEANGGTIWMEPRTEGGTTFHFTLMLAE